MNLGAVPLGPTQDPTPETGNTDVGVRSPEVVSLEREGGRRRRASVGGAGAESVGAWRERWREAGLHRRKTREGDAEAPLHGLRGQEHGPQETESHSGQ